MKIKNYTKYNTADLKKLFLACCREVRTGRVIRKRLVVEVVEKARANSRANYWGTWVQINIGKTIGYEDKTYTRPTYDGKNTYTETIRKGIRGTMSIREIAWIACHEFLHSKGLHHRRITARHRYFSHWAEFTKDKNRMAWADQYQLRKKEVKPKPQTDWQLIRYERVKARVKEYISKVKRCQNLLKKYLQKQRRYEKVLTAAGKIRPKEQ